MIGIFRIFVATAGMVSAADLAGLHPLNQDMDDCKRKGPGTPVPDEDTFQLPLEAYQNTRSYPLCRTDSSDCSTFSPLDFDFLNESIIFTYDTFEGYTYNTVSLKASVPVLTNSLGKTYTIGQGCDLAFDKTTVICSVPFSDIVGGIGDSVTGMCPNADSAGYTLQIQASAVLQDTTGKIYSFKHKKACTDYPTCVNKVDYWELAYRCTKCPGTPPASSQSGCAPSCRATATIINTQTVKKTISGAGYTLTAGGETRSVREYVTRSYVSAVTTTIAGKDYTYRTTILEKTPVTYSHYITKSYETTVTKLEAGKTHSYISTIVSKEPVTEKVLITRTFCPAEKTSCTRKHAEETGKAGHHDEGSHDSGKHQHDDDKHDGGRHGN